MTGTPPLILVMGVSGSGKTTVGKLLAAELRIPFYDGDDYHPQANREKMARGEPLDDHDRAPWLELLNRKLHEWAQTGAVLACSALKQKYRDALSHDLPRPLTVIYLKGTEEVIVERLRRRQGHYMPVSLLDSQFADLEEPRNAIIASVAQPPEEIVRQIVAKLPY